MNSHLNQIMMIPGPAGQIEASLTHSAEAGVSAVAVLCHPHSQYGGSMHDAVLEFLGEACSDAGMSVLKFNFRSVGASEGAFADGVGEVEDVLAVIQWVQSEYTEAEINLGGYSFGAAMALLAAARVKSDVSRLMLIAPPIQMVESDAALEVPMKVIVGGRDTIVSATAAGQYFDSEQMTVLPQADHFFAGSSADIKSIMGEFIQQS